MEVVYLPEAQQDFDESFDWYAQRSPIAARRFVLAVDAAIERVTQSPGIFPFVAPGHQDCPLKRFPFRIVYRQLPGQILIVAVAHAKRNPGYWKYR